MTFTIFAAYVTQTDYPYLQCKTIVARSRELALARFFNEAKDAGRQVGDYAIVAEGEIHKHAAAIELLVQESRP